MKSLPSLTALDEARLVWTVTFLSVCLRVFATKRWTWWHSLARHVFGSGFLSNAVAGERNQSMIETLSLHCCGLRVSKDVQRQLAKKVCWRFDVEETLGRSWKYFWIHHSLSKFWMYLEHATAPMLCTWFPIHPPCNRMLENVWPNASCNGAGAMAAGFLEWWMFVHGWL